MGCVLLVEDNWITRKVVRVTLATEGHEVLEAEDGCSALAEVERRCPDLILQDLALPDMDGVELFAELRNRVAMRTPIVAFTGMSDDQFALSAGFTDILTKPVEPERLLEAVKLHLRHSSSGRPQRMRRVLLVADDPVQLRAQQVALEKAGLEVMAVKSGLEALQRAEQIEPDLFALDFVMPGVSGLELCCKLRSLPGFRTTPVLLLTSQTLSPSELDVATRAGADRTVTRTTDTSELVRSALELLQAPGTRPYPVQSTLPPQSRDLLHRLTVEDALLANLARQERLWEGQQALLARLTEQAGSPTPLDDVLADALAMLLDASGASVGAAYLCDPFGTLALRTQIGFQQWEEQRVASFWGHSALLQGVLADGTTRTMDGAQASGEDAQLLAELGVRSLVMVPLQAANEPLGVLVLGSANSALAREGTALANTLAGPLAQAILLARTVARVVASEHKFRGIAEAVGDGLLVCDDAGVISYANPSAESILALDASAILGRCISELVPFLRMDPGVSQGVLRAKDGREIPVEVSLRRFEGTARMHHRIAILHDLSETLKLREVTYWANHDLLTGLFNRRRFEEELPARLAEAARHGTTGAVLMLDLDEFKPINDRFGHIAGDDVLKAVGHTIRTSIRASDVAARLGGDEFVVLLPNTGAVGARRCAETLLANISSLRVEHGPQRLAVGASVGVAVFPLPAGNAEDVLGAADAALYVAKRSGRNRVSLAPGVAAHVSRSRKGKALS